MFRLRHKLPFSVRLNHLLIQSQWRRWWFPALCALPYLGALIWLGARQQIWIAQVLLAPLLMGLLLALLTLWLANQEFRSHWPR